MAELITKQQAVELGLKRYFTGKSCRRGHVCERDIRGACVECDRAQASKWRRANPDKIAAKNKRWAVANVGKRSATYRSWEGMKSRCLNPNKDQYKNYGQRGIIVCDRWVNSFPNFLADMGERPAGKTLDRYPDNDGNYEPDNCRWATSEQQNNNQRKRRAGLKRRRSKPSPAMWL